MWVKIDCIDTLALMILATASNMVLSQFVKSLFLIIVKFEKVVSSKDWSEFYKLWEFKVDLLLSAKPGAGIDFAV